VRLHQFLITTVLVSLALNTAKAIAPTDPKDSARSDTASGSSFTTNGNVRVPLATLRTRLIAEDKVMAAAYYDSLSILSTINRCSEFFGGPAVAVDVFNHMIGQVEKDYLAAAIGMEMSGITMNFSNAVTRAEFRLFDKVKLNANGPFYRRDSGAHGRVGSFSPSTREARVLIFLHELGHVVKGPDGKWLLPNDGHDMGLSRHNSTVVEKVCGDEIKGLGTSEAALSLAKHLQAEAALALTSTTDEPAPELQD
jgi:hypothetical protein